MQSEPIPDTGATKYIEGRQVRICSRNTFRGTPSPRSQKEKIGQDGKEQKYTIKVLEKFECPIKNETKKDVSSFWVTEGMYTRLDRLSAEKTIDQMFDAGMHTNPLIACKVKSQKPNGNNYWTLLTPQEYEKADVVKPEK